MKCTKRVKAKILWGVAISVLLILMIYSYTQSPQAYAYQYIGAYNSKNWEVVHTSYVKDGPQNQFGKEEVFRFLKERIEKDGYVEIRKTDPVGTFIQLQMSSVKSYFVGKEKFEVEIPVEYILHDKKVKASLNMVRDQETKKWGVKFPYKLESIYVLAPMGSTIYIDQKKIKEENLGDEIEIKNMLPGSHTVTIEYYNDLYPSFTQEIYVPKETKVQSPYPTLDVQIKAPLETWITLGEVTKYNAGGNVIFNNVIDGEYNIIMAMEDKALEVLNERFGIDKNSTLIQLGERKIDKGGKDILKEFFQGINVEYQKGIVNGDVDFLHQFIVQGNIQDVVSDFKEWYVDYKDIEEATSRMEVRDVYVLSGKELKASVLEIVYLTNKEEGVEGNITKQVYRVAIEWDYKLVREDFSWKIVKRDICQSTVAYKDEQGKWIQY